MDDGDGKTYFDAVVDGNLAKVNVYRDLGTGIFTKTEAIELMPRTGMGIFVPAQYEEIASNWFRGTILSPSIKNY
jgi:hypothetical protein